MLKFIFISAAITAVVLLGFSIDNRSTDPPRRPPSAPSGPMRVHCPGRIEGATEETQLRPQLAGQIVRLAVAEGQAVEAGQVLLELDDKPYRHAQSLAKAELRLSEGRLARLLNGARQQERDEAAALLRAKEAEREQAELSWERVKKLVASDALTDQEADDQRTQLAAIEAHVEAAEARVDLLSAEAREDEVEMAQAEIEAARAKLDLAGVPLERSKLVAPAAGQILRVNVEAGEMTGPDTPLAAIVFADTSRFQVRAFVEEIDAPRVAVGMTASIAADGLPDETFTGRVVRLSPRMTHKQLFTDDPAEHYDTKVREIWIELEPTATSLVIGLRVDVTID